MQPSQSPQPGEFRIEVTPQPVPFQPLIQDGTLPDGKPVVIMQVFTVMGQLVFFMPPEGATEIGQQLIQHGRSASTGLVLPPGIRLGSPEPHTPNGHKPVATEGENG